MYIEFAVSAQACKLLRVSLKTSQHVHTAVCNLLICNLGVGCRLSQLRRSGLLQKSNSPRGLPISGTGIVVPTASPTLCPSLGLEQSEAVSSGSGPAPPWPTPAQLKQTLAAFGRAQAEENAHILASRCCCNLRLMPSGSFGIADQTFISLFKRFHSAVVQKLCSVNSRPLPLTPVLMQP